ncbi:unnamed protein product [Protopolystoma xenopodis]|uniref:Innexin n=1 Tax=Protopolystoma xenopodis TaxID=117903 RepID=A0A448XN02_9PLAT|nr:unnamed protein product [Protopolystoma xenopodis]
MLGAEFLEQLTKLQVTTYVGVEDFADRFNFLVTIMVILLCTTVVTVKQYILKPISCYVPTELGGRNILDYVENYCWVQGTIPIRYDEKVPDTSEGWNELEEHKLRESRDHYVIFKTIHLHAITTCLLLALLS